MENFNLQKKKDNSTFDKIRYDSARVRILIELSTSSVTKAKPQSGRVRLFSSAGAKPDGESLYKTEFFQFSRNKGVPFIHSSVVRSVVYYIYNSSSYYLKKGLTVVFIFEFEFPIRPAVLSELLSPFHLDIIA